MSRCFPFPPHGYAKIRPDNASLVIKEKHKKHKKDKEKKEKHKDDKDRKEKKHKNRGKKHKPSEEKNNNAGFEDYRILSEFGKRLRADDGAVDSFMLQKITSMDQRLPKLLEKVEEHHSDHKFFKVGAGEFLQNGFVNENEKIRQMSNNIRSNEEHRHERESKKSEDKESSKEKIESIKGPIKWIRTNIESVDFRGPSNISMKKAAESNGFLQVNGSQPNSNPRAVPRVHRDKGSHQNGSFSYPRQNITNVAARKAAIVSSSTHIINVQRPNNSTSNHGRATANNHLVSNGFVPSPENHRVHENRSPSLQPSAEKEKKATYPNFDEPDEKDSRKKPKKSRKEKPEKSTKGPHPDSKHLEKVLTVPSRVVEWPIWDDQQWLFCCSKRRKLAAAAASAFTEPMKEVWAEAVRLEIADVIALPYVVPY